jgi:hypothetical protein
MDDFEAIMYITITSDTEPTTRPDGSSLEEADKWVNGDVTKVYMVPCYSQEDIDLYNEPEEDDGVTDANTFVFESSEPEIDEANTVWPDEVEPETLEVTSLPGQWVIENEELVVEVDGLTFTIEPIPQFDFEEPDE